MSSKNERLSVLSDAEQFALYGLPDFDDRQQMEFLSLSESELALVSCRPSLHAQIYCALQIGYFKAKHAFFRFDWCDVEDDSAFVLSRYFNGEQFEPESISNQCCRLVANGIIYYNSAILSRLLTKHEASGNTKAVELLTRISPVAWQHILLNGHYRFQGDGKTIDIDTLIAELEL